MFHKLKVLPGRPNFFIIIDSSEYQKKTLRKESGVTEKGGAFDVLKCFSGQ